MPRSPSAPPDPTPLYNLPFWIAHTPRKGGKTFHPLADHALEVARLASEFAQDLGHDAPALAYYLGILHDLGKFTPAFQEYLLRCHLHDNRKGDRPAKGSAPHKQHGALAAVLLDATLGRIWRLPLFGHHGGMKSEVDTHSKITGALDPNEDGLAEGVVRGLLALSASVDARLTPVPPDTAALTQSALWQEQEARELFVRMLFSCLTDADARDTEAHTNPNNADKRAAAPRPDLATLGDLLTARQETDFATAEDTAVNRVRRDVYQACRRVGADVAPGFFDLTVPTGGGKTRSSLAFALEHARAHGLKRIIYAIPYTSIIDQTVDVFRGIFGHEPGTVLEHHSAVDPLRAQKGEPEEQDRAQKSEEWRLLASEDWDAPLICTTTVQLFESLFSNRPGACRKLHRLAQSVIVLDEAQCLPPHLLGPIRSGLKTLVEHFGATVVFCTATQPAHDVKSRWLEGITSTPIVPDPRPHFAALKRVVWRDEPEPWDWPRVAEEMLSASTSCITVVNTRQQALDLITALRAMGASADELLHLSTLLCGAHRRKVIADVTARLVTERKKGGPRVLLVSTQVIEAGVDLSAPRVLRAMGPLERIIQAAGRCNREGELWPALGQVTVFQPLDDAAPSGFYRRGLMHTQNLMGAGPVDFDNPNVVTAYFAHLYGDLGDGADARKINIMRAKLHFEDVARAFRMIDEDTVSVFTTGYDFENAKKILDKVRPIGRVTRELWRDAQPFTVSLPRHAVDKMPANSIVEEAPGFSVWQGKYDPLTGIPLTVGIADLAAPPASLMC